MPKIFIPLVLAFLFPQFAVAATHSLDDSVANEQAEIYNYTDFIGTIDLTADAKPNDMEFLGYKYLNVDVTKNAGLGLGVSTREWGRDDNSPALEYYESLVFTFSDEVLLTGFTITPGNQPAHYFEITNKDDDTDIGFTINSETGFVSFTSGTISVLSFAITGLVNCTGLFVESIESASTVPLPAALPLYAAGMSVLGFLGWRRKRKSNI
jgi:hypothetical protein